MIELNLKTDLAKVRQAFNAGELQAQKGPMPHGCHYNGPCAVGVMIDHDLRSDLDGRIEAEVLGGSISSLAATGIISIPEDQVDDFRRLQSSHDITLVNRPEAFGALLTKLEAKYAS